MTQTIRIFLDNLNMYDKQHLCKRVHQWTLITTMNDWTRLALLKAMTDTTWRTYICIFLDNLNMYDKQYLCKRVHQRTLLTTMNDWTRLALLNSRLDNTTGPSFQWNQIHRVSTLFFSSVFSLSWHRFALFGNSCWGFCFSLLRQFSRKRDFIFLICLNSSLFRLWLCNTFRRLF